jgi:hypothetical protein
LKGGKSKKDDTFVNKMEIAVTKNYKGVNVDKTIKTIQKRLDTELNISAMLTNKNDIEKFKKIIDEEMGKNIKLTNATNKIIEDMGGAEKIKEQIELIHTFEESNNIPNQEGGDIINNMKTFIVRPYSTLINRSKIEGHVSRLLATTIYILGVLSHVYIIGIPIAVYMAIKENKKQNRSTIFKTKHITLALIGGWLYIMYLHNVRIATENNDNLIRIRNQQINKK